MPHHEDKRGKGSSSATLSSILEASSLPLSVGPFNTSCLYLYGDSIAVRCTPMEPEVPGPGEVSAPGRVKAGWIAVLTDNQ